MKTSPPGYNALLRAKQWRRRRAPSSSYARYAANLQRSPVGNVMRLAEEESLLCVVADWRPYAARGWIIAVTRSCRTVSTSCDSLMSNCCYASSPTGDGMQHFANYAVNRTSANWQQWWMSIHDVELSFLCWLHIQSVWSGLGSDSGDCATIDNRQHFRINSTHWSCLWASFRKGRGWDILAGLYPLKTPPNKLKSFSFSWRSFK